MTQIGGNMGMTVKDCLDLRNKEQKYNFLLDIDGTITEERLCYIQVFLSHSKHKGNQTQIV